MRGEDQGTPKFVSDATGSPPHARGRPFSPRSDLIQTRITPACAGKTVAPAGDRRRTQDHPRMRGEDPPSCCGEWWAQGSPPHARGRQATSMCPRQADRITPACAGKTRVKLHRWKPFTDHPRMRGEDVPASPCSCPSQGSPPHARGRRRRIRRGVPAARITPACAGKTLYRPLPYGQPRDHPRMRGEDLATIFVPKSRAGSPPHARGRLVTNELALSGMRITPACAGKT